MKELRAERDKLAETVPATDDTKVKVINGLREALEQERGVSRTLGDTCQRFHDEKAKMKIEGDRMREAIAGLRDKVLAHLPCVCSENRSICHRHEIAETLDDFERQAGVYEAKETERDDVTPPAATPPAQPCDPERIKDKLVIRFDGLPGPEPAGFVEVEINGASVNVGEWIEDGEYWLLVIKPDAIPLQKLPSDLASRRGEHIRALMAERDRLIAKYRDTKTQILNRTPCRCLKEGVRLAEPHLPTCPSKIVMTIFDEFGE